MIDQTVHAAVDIGYGEVKGLCTPSNFGKQPFEFSIPSLVCPIQGNDIEVSGSVLIKSKRNTVLVNGQYYLVGEDQGHIVKHLSDDYIQSDYYMALYYAALRMIGHKSIDILVTGLPVFQYSIQAPELIQRMEGEHEIEPGYIVKVKKVKVFPQPLGSLIEFFHRNRLKDARAMNVVICDPGHYTFDWLVTRNGQFNITQSGSINEGVSHIIEAMIQMIKKDHDDKSPSYNMINQTLRDGKTSARMYGKEIELSKYLTAALNIQAKKAIQKMKNKLRGLEDIDAFVITGGGAPLYGPYIAEAFPNHKVEIMQGSVKATAYGFFRESFRKG